MTLQRILIITVAASLFGCASEPDGSVAVRDRKQLTWSEGTIAFDVDRQFVEASEQLHFDIVSLVSARSDDGPLNCRVATLASQANRVWIDSSGNQWVRIGRSSKITYRRSESNLEARIDGVAVADCDVSTSHSITLNVLFDARPRPNGWSGEGMHGFEVLLPQERASGEP